MDRLSVFLYGAHLGHLVRLKDSPSGRYDDFDFIFADTAFESFSMGSSILSVALPLVLHQDRKKAARRRNFFHELLPEGHMLTYLANRHRIAEADTFEMLRHYGLDIAGALEICEEGTHWLEGGSDGLSPEYKQVSDADIRSLLEKTAQFPLGNALDSGKTSLAGVQTKILLAYDKATGWAQVRNGAASTHIIKPPVEKYPTLIYDEAFGLDLARACGLIEYFSHIETFNGLDALVIERYDRVKDTSRKRIHQEDFNQALGVAGNQKYQEYSGKVSLKRIADTVKKFAGAEDVLELARQMIFSFLIGNLDMHAKNLSLLHLPNEDVALAPAYDLVPLQHQNTDGKMALKIGGEYYHARIGRDEIVNELLSWKLPAIKSAESAVAFVSDFSGMAEGALEQIDIHPKAYPRLKDNVRKNIRLVTI